MFHIIPMQIWRLLLTCVLFLVITPRESTVKLMTLSSSSISCEKPSVSGDANIPNHQMSGDTETGVTIEFSRWTDEFYVPYVYPHEYWREVEECYESITKIVTKNMRGIGNSAFRDLQRLETLEADEYLTTIGPYAFAGSSLHQIVAPSLSKIDTGAFQYATNLPSTFEVSSTMTFIGDYALQGTLINTVDVRKATTLFEFGDYVFQDCGKLTTFLVSDGVGSWSFRSTGLFEGCMRLSELKGLERSSVVGPRAFMGCSLLSKFPFNEYLTELGDSAFEGTRFYSIEMRACSSIERVGHSVFKDCLQLRDVDFDGSYKMWDDASTSMFEGCLELSSVNLEQYYQATIAIPARFFYGCGRLQNLVTILEHIPKVTSIGESAFQGMNLETIDMSALTECQTIAAGAFKDTQTLRECVLPPQQTAISESLFSHCALLEKVSGGGTITSIGSWAFYLCASFSTLECTTDLTRIEAFTFCGCQSFSKSDIITASLTFIGPNAFEESGLVTVDFSGCATLELEAPSLFKKSKLQECTLWNNAASGGRPWSIPSSCFEECLSLRAVKGMAETNPVINGIGAYAFRGCQAFSQMDLLGASRLGDEAFAGTGYQELTFTDSMNYASSFGSGLFKGCTSLTKCVFAEFQTIVLSGFFEGCVNLREVQIDTEILETVDSYAFKDCASFSDTKFFKAFQINAGAFEGTGFTSIDLTPYELGATWRGSGLFKNCKQLTSCVIGQFFSGMLPSETFDGCSLLSNLVGSDRFYTIGSAALRGCSLLTEFAWSNVEDIYESAFEGTGVDVVDLTQCQLREIGESAFKDCVKLKECSLPETPDFRTIQQSAFEGCIELTSITIPANVDTIGEGCFRNCQSLHTVKYLGTWNISSNLFEGCTSLKTVEVTSDYHYDQFGGWSFKKPDGGGGGDSGNSGPGKLPGGAIAGIVIAVLIVIGAVVGVLVFFLVVRKRREHLMGDQCNVDA